jgi:hypothetical protein
MEKNGKEEETYRKTRQAERFHPHPQRKARKEVTNKKRAELLIQ